MSVVSKEAVGEINPQNVGHLNVNGYAPGGLELEEEVAGGLKKFAKSAIRSLSGNISGESFGELVTGVAEYEKDLALYSAQPFRYAALPGIREEGMRCTAEGTVRSATMNMRMMRSMFGDQAFSAIARKPRHHRAVVLSGQLDEDYEIQVRGGAGAGTFSIDFGLGTRNQQSHSYNELWRSGVDTVHAEGRLGTRFIRTGSGIKHDSDFGGKKTASFKEFRRRYGMLPQRMIGMMGLYFMRELNPDFAVALTSEGATRLSTLGRSQGACDYTGIFRNIGFLPSSNRYWQYIPEFNDEGFYDALTRAGIRKREADGLNRAADAINTASNVDGTVFPIKLCSDESPETLRRELSVHMPKPALAY
ncbi:MAG TPA: hypothetical protein VFX86_00325 [Candidatus Saccharimonadales bacterium]|nr:hypothetical protein [Candidatus Saccharimonadales bacterium]